MLIRHTISKVLGREHVKSSSLSNMPSDFAAEVLVQHLEQILLTDGLIQAVHFDSALS